MEGTCLAGPTLSSGPATRAPPFHDLSILSCLPFVLPLEVSSCTMTMLIKKFMALAGLVTVLHACLDMKSTILGKYHYVLYALVLAMQARMLMTANEDLKPLSVPVRVGQAVDMVVQAGCPKTITSFQTHSTPVLLAAGERAELATGKYIPLASALEGYVISKENPEYHEDH